MADSMDVSRGGGPGTRQSVMRQSANNQRGRTLFTRIPIPANDTKRALKALVDTCSRDWFLGRHFSNVRELRMVPLEQIPDLIQRLLRIDLSMTLAVLRRVPDWEQFVPLVVDHLQALVQVVRPWEKARSEDISHALWTGRDVYRNDTLELPRNIDYRALGSLWDMLIDTEYQRNTVHVYVDMDKRYMDLEFSRVMGGDTGIAPKLVLAEEIAQMILARVSDTELSTLSLTDPTDTPTTHPSGYNAYEHGFEKSPLDWIFNNVPIPLPTKGTVAQFRANQERDGRTVDYYGRQDLTHKQFRRMPMTYTRISYDANVTLPIDTVSMRYMETNGRVPLWLTYVPIQMLVVNVTSMTMKHLNEVAAQSHGLQIVSDYMGIPREVNLSKPNEPLWPLIRAPSVKVVDFMGIYVSCNTLGLLSPNIEEVIVYDFTIDSCTCPKPTRCSARKLSTPFIGSRNWRLLRHFPEARSIRFNEDDHLPSRERRADAMAEAFTVAPHITTVDINRLLYLPLEEFMALGVLGKHLEQILFTQNSVADFDENLIRRVFGQRGFELTVHHGGEYETTRYTLTRNNRTRSL